MFNNLNNAANQERQAVDDIFAETDKAMDNNPPNVSNPISSPNQLPSKTEIETRHVGLTAGDELLDEPAEKSGGKWFKIVLILIVAAILILGGYLVYSKFLKVSPEINSNQPAPVVDNSQTENQTPAPASEEIGSFVATTSGTETVNSNTDTANQTVPTTIIPEIPDVNAPVTSTAPTTSTTAAASTSASMLDSDSDGLSDAEEIGLGTNINIIDTDNDGLSDYEEVRIYHTNPLSADTDGDSFLDGQEIKGGYNPNGPGKLAQ